MRKASNDWDRGCQMSDKIVAIFHFQDRVILSPMSSLQWRFGGDGPADESHLSSGTACLTAVKV